MRWRHWLFALPLLLAVGAPAARATAAAPKTVAVEIRNFHFMPTDLTVRMGTTVTWTNRDDDPHTVTSVDGQFKNSAALDTGDSYSVVFAKPGTYKYFCSVHPQMVATIVVR